MEKGESTASYFGRAQWMGQRGVMGKFWSWLLSLLVFTSQACIVIPVPESKVFSGRPITDEELSFLEPNLTTKADVIGLLGEPTVFWQDEDVFAYDWGMLQAVMPWILPGPYTAAYGVEHIGSKYILLIQFDENDLVKRFERTRRSPFDSYGEHLLDWIEQQEGRESTSPHQENGEK